VAVHNCEPCLRTASAISDCAEATVSALHLSTFRLARAARSKPLTGCEGVAHQLPARIHIFRMHNCARRYWPKPASVATPGANCSGGVFGFSYLHEFRHFVLPSLPVNKQTRAVHARDVQPTGLVQFNMSTHDPFPQKSRC